MATAPPFPPVDNEGSSGDLFVQAKVFTNAGWVIPGDTYPLVLSYEAQAAVTSATVEVTLHDSAMLVSSAPTANSGDGTTGNGASSGERPSGPQPAGGVGGLAVHTGDGDLGLDLPARITVHDLADLYQDGSPAYPDLTPGTTANVRVLTQDRPPITLVIPILQTWFSED